MNMAQKILQKGWQSVKLGQICDITGGGTPSRSVEKYFTGDIPWATPTDVTALNCLEIEHTATRITQEAIENSSTRILPPGCVLLTSRATIGFTAINTVPICTNQGFANFECKSRLNNYFLAYYLPHIKERLLNLAGGSIYKEINKSTLKKIEIPLPPLPVQERIVQILQKADEIRRKRQKAVAIADAILPAIFRDMFGTTENALIKFGAASLQELADVRSGVTKGRKLQGRETIEVPYLRVANVQDGYLDLSEIKMIEVLSTDFDKYHLEDGDVLMTEGGDFDKLGRGYIWRNEVHGCIHQNHVFRVRTNRSLILPEVLAALLRTEYAKEYFLRCAKRSSNLASVNSTQVKAFQIPLIPISLQKKFVSAVQQWNQATKNTKYSLKELQALQQSLMQQAFTGELTAEWEAANAEQIAAKQKFYQRLPQFVILSFLKQKISRIQRQKADTAVLLTALMKYVFLFQMEGTTKRKLYQFIPYHYGPFAKELYTDLETLQEQGLITVDDSDEDKTRISLLNSEAVEAALAELPADLQADIKAIIDSYGELDLTSLLATVYEKYPTYAKKSKLKQLKPKPKKEEN